MTLPHTISSGSTSSAASRTIALKPSTDWSALAAKTAFLERETSFYLGWPSTISDCKSVIRGFESHLGLYDIE